MFQRSSISLIIRIRLWWVLLVWVAGQALAADTAPRVLVLFSNDRLLPANVKYEAGIRAALGPEGGRPAAAIYAEFLDAVRVRGPEHAELFQDYLRFRYRENRPDVVVAIGMEALEFLLRRRSALFPETPLAFGGVNQADLARLGALRGVAGLPMELPLAPGVDALLAMRPQTRELLIVSGASDYDRNLHATALAQCARYAGRLRVVSSVGQSPEDLKRRLAALPPEAAVLYLSYFRSPSGETMVPFDVAAMVAGTAAAPVIVPYETYLGTGVLGGCVTPFEDQGRDLGAVIRRLLAGEDPARIGVLPPTQPRLVFDIRQVKRWGIPLASLPAGSELRYRTPSIWEQHRGLVIAGGAVLLLQTGLIIALLTLRARHLRAEEKIQQARERLAHAMRLATLGELAASIAHEVNQPLGAILSNTEAAEMLMADDNPPLDEVRHILADIRRDDLRASEVVKRVRSLVGRQQVTMVPLDLNDTAAAVVRLVAHDANRRGVTVRHEPAATLPPVCGDRVQLEQLLLNLLLNAMDAMQDTPLAQRLITLRTAAGDDDWVEVSVTDRGHGLDPERIDRVFDSFFTTKDHGMGLGLALARSIAEAHGGRLTGANQSAGGAVFRLLLPAVALSSSHVHARSAVPDCSFGG